MPRPTAAYRTVAKLAILAIGNTEYGNQRALSSRKSNGNRCVRRPRLDPKVGVPQRDRLVGRRRRHGCRTPATPAASVAAGAGFSCDRETLIVTAGTSTFIARITDLARRPSSVNGNPRWLVTFDTGAQHLIQSDSSLSYSIGNREYHRAQVKVTLTKAGRIADLAPVPPGYP